MSISINIAIIIVEAQFYPRMLIELYVLGTGIYARGRERGEKERNNYQVNKSANKNRL